MIRRLAALALGTALLAPGLAHARSLAREGTVAILPGARFSQAPDGTDGSPVAPELGLSFGFKPSASLEVGIDVLGSRTTAKPEAGGELELTGVPLLLRFSWTPMPDYDVRPLLTAGLGKALVSVDGAGGYREHTPWAALATVGMQADLSSSLGLWIDGGYLFARADDPKIGRVDGGGILARAGLYFRFEPIPERRF